MSYYFTTSVTGAIDDVEQKVRAALGAQGFGVLTYIDVQATMKAKLDADIPPYRILGACNPPFAYQALQAENKIGTMLPCNVVVQQTSEGTVEVAAVDPIASMQAVGNPALTEIANEVRGKLQAIIESL
jgi:uncharacterized protein (DUF302 family)